MEEEMPAARVWMDRMLEAISTRNDLLGKAEAVLNPVQGLATDRREIVNNFLSTSTVYQKWGYDPDHYDKNGKKIKVKIDPIMKTKFDRMSTEEQNIAKDVFKFSHDIRLQMQEVVDALGVSEFFNFETGLEGPYAALKRLGDNVAELKSQSLMDAEAAKRADLNERTKKLVEKLRSDPDHYIFQTFDSIGAAKTFALANKGKFAHVDWSEKKDTLDERVPGAAKVYEKIAGAIQANAAGLDASSKAAMVDMVRNMYFQTLEDNNARLSGSKRLNIAGYEKDMLRSFAVHAQSQANLVTQMKHGAEIAEALVEVDQQVRIDKNGNPRSNTERYREFHNDLVKKFKAIIAPRNGVFEDIENQVLKFNSSMMLTSSVGYMGQNLIQPVYAVNMVAGDMGVTRAASTMAAQASGYKIARSIIDSGFFKQLANVASLSILGGDVDVKYDFKKAPPELEPMLKKLQDYGLLDVGLAEDLRLQGANGGNIGTKAYRRVTNRLYQSSRYVEAMNRISTAVMAFKMAQKNPKVMKRIGLSPTEYAIRVVQDTQGNFTKLDAPAMFDIPGSRALMQFKRYPIQMLYMHIDAFKQAFVGASKEDKIAGASKLALYLTTTSLLAGAVGMPMANLAFSAALAGIDWIDDDDDLDQRPTLERWIRDNIEDEDMANLLSRGVPAYLGFDISQKTTLDNIAFPFYNEYISADKEDGGLLGAFAQTMLGPTASHFNSGTRALDYIDKGEYRRAAEVIAPKGLRSYLEAARYKTDGYKIGNSTALTPDEFDIIDAVTTAIGLPSTHVNHVKWTSRQQYEIKQHFRDESTRIRREYRNAASERDRAETSRLRSEFKELQKAKDRARRYFSGSPHELRRSPLSSLLRVPREDRRNQRKMDRAWRN